MLERRFKSLKWRAGYCFTALVICFSLLPLRIDASNVYGAPCEGSCHFDRLHCSEKTKRCECHLNETLQYNDKAEATCVYHFSDPLTDVNKQCIEFPCSSYEFCHRGHCACKPTYITVSINGAVQCKKYLYKSPIQGCSIHEEIAQICDIEKNSHCKEAKCTCFEGHYYNETQNICLVINAAKLFNTSKGTRNEMSKKDGLPGYPCSINYNCVSGLVCRQSDLVCACPKQCEYKPEDGGCDCGAMEYKTEPAVICVGLLLGIVSCVFWIFRIRKTYRNMRDKKQNNDYDNPAEDEDEMNSVYENIQPNQHYNRPDANFENKSSVFNDPPPAYSSLMNNPNPIGFVNPVPVAPSTESSPWAPSYTTPLQTQNESTPFSNASLSNNSGLPYPIISPTSNYNSSLLTNPSIQNESSLPYPISSPLPSLPSDTQDSKLPYSIVPPTASLSTSTTASAPHFPDSNTTDPSTNISSSTNSTNLPYPTTPSFP